MRPFSQHHPELLGAEFDRQLDPEQRGADGAILFMGKYLSELRPRFAGMPVQAKRAGAVSRISDLQARHSYQSAALARQRDCGGPGRVEARMAAPHGQPGAFLRWDTKAFTLVPAQ
jgi:hypothetical protein